MQEVLNYLCSSDTNTNNRVHTLGMSKTTIAIINKLIDLVENPGDEDGRLEYELLEPEYRDVIISAGEYENKDVNLNILDVERKKVTKVGFDIYYDDADRYFGINLFTSSSRENSEVIFTFNIEIKKWLVYLKSQDRLNKFRELLNTAAC